MHPQAFDWVSQWATDETAQVLDIGGRNINGSVRSLFPNAAVYTVLDIEPGDGVEIVADASTWVPDREYDVVVCTEVFEHTAAWPAICRVAQEALRPGGLFVVTMAGPGRLPHSAVDGGPHLYDGEHYANVDPVELLQTLHDLGWRDVTVDFRPESSDTRAVATK